MNETQVNAKNRQEKDDKTQHMRRFSFNMRRESKTKDHDIRRR